MLLTMLGGRKNTFTVLTLDGCCFYQASAVRAILFIEAFIHEVDGSRLLFGKAQVFLGTHTCWFTFAPIPCTCAVLSPALIVVC
jgi:hypothetical protein